SPLAHERHGSRQGDVALAWRLSIPIGGGDVDAAHESDQLPALGEHAEAVDVTIRSLPREQEPVTPRGGDDDVVHAATLSHLSSPLQKLSTGASATRFRERYPSTGSARGFG